MFEIIEPRSEAELDDVRRLMRAFIGWVHRRYSKELELIEKYFDAGAFEAELSGLPGKYSRPEGRLLLARDNARGVGCVGLRALDDGCCEMKRLYVESANQRKGTGRALVTALVREAKSAGYVSMRLDTGPASLEAQSLYRSAGFRVVQPYYEIPEELHGWLVFMELDLAGCRV